MLSELGSFSRILASNVMRLGHPYKLTFALTYRCNLHCKICSIWQKQRTPELSREELDTFFSRSNRFAWVAFTGGEAFLRPDITEIAASAVRHCRHLCVLSFPTNGYDTALIVGKVKEILALHPPRLFVTVSLDGPPRIHDEMRRQDGSWVWSLNTFLELKKLKGVTAILSMTLSKFNSSSIDETLRAVQAEYPAFDVKRDMNFNLFQRSGHYYGNQDAECPDQAVLRQDVARATDLVYQRSFKGFLQSVYLNYAADYFKNGRSPLQCQALSASCFIDPSGTIYPCTIYDRPLANIRDYGYDIAKIWNGKDVTRAFTDCRGGKCPGCWSPCEAYTSINGALLRSVKKFLSLRGMLPVR